MSRSICVYLNFPTEEHRRAIEEAAAETGFTVRFFTSQQREEARAYVRDAEVLYSASPGMLRRASALRWYCCSNAGVESYCADPSLFPNPDCILTNSNVYGVTIAEHIVMVTLMLLRRMPEYTEITRERLWSGQLPIRSIRGSRFTILGTGDIGANTAERLRGMNAGSITGLSRSGRPSAAFDRVLPISALDTVLPETDILVMALPATAETRHILSRERIALLPRDAYVINVGRGGAIDQKALMDALNGDQLAGAALDVMEPEPLPPDHPLWETKNLLLTPHISGNMSLGYTQDRNVELFCRNLRNYASGRPLDGLVDRTLGY